MGIQWKFIGREMFIFFVNSIVRNVFKKDTDLVINNMYPLPTI